MCGIWALLSKKDIKEFGALYESFMMIKNRGPEYSSFDLITAKSILGFHRLAIMDMTAEGNQPFKHVRKDGSCIYCICNGEIYDFEKLKREYDIETKSHSDCEVIIPLYERFGFERTMSLLGGEFACVIIDISSGGDAKLFAGRDPIGVRPLFYGIERDSENNISGACLSSELKGIPSSYKEVNVFSPGHYFSFDSFTPSNDLDLIPYYSHEYVQDFTITKEIAMKEIRERFTAAVKKRLMADRPFGCLLSGGLDSSLVASVAKSLVGKDETFPVFTIGFNTGSTDIPYAKKVAEHLGLDHHIFLVSKEEALSALRETVRIIESYDITSVRASVMQLLLARKIKETTNVRILLVGENSDEIFMGYLYNHNAPSDEEAHLDRVRLVKDVHRFDGLRTDRTMAYEGLEVRPPFCDPEFVNYAMTVPVNLIKPKNGLEKALLRDAFSGSGLLPDDVLYRRKEAFSDAVSTHKKGESWYEIIQEFINEEVSDEDFEAEKDSFGVGTKEAYFYKKEFVKHFGTRSLGVIPYYWMPKWTPETSDPSARTLNIY
jgi:asparagine synthase (glutamine-hydrolysing)